jgi:hypothetical protein
VLHRYGADPQLLCKPPLGGQLGMVRVMLSDDILSQFFIDLKIEWLLFSVHLVL